MSKALYLNITTSSNSCYFCHKDERENFTYVRTKWCFPIPKWILSCFCHVFLFLPTIFLVFAFLLPHTAHIRPFSHCSAFHCSVPGFTHSEMFSLFCGPCLCLYTARSVGSSSERMLSWCHYPWRSVYCLYRSHENLCQWWNNTEHHFDSDVLGFGPRVGQDVLYYLREQQLARAGRRVHCILTVAVSAGKHSMARECVLGPWQSMARECVRSMAVHDMWVWVLGPWQSMARECVLDPWQSMALECEC